MPTMTTETDWVTFCRRTEDPKLAYIERWLNSEGIPNRRNGESWHAPILEVPERYLDKAHELLDDPVEVDGTIIRFDDVDDDDPMFTAL
jgi:hypothetical protein